jgi:hypothetical protein
LYNTFDKMRIMSLRQTFEQRQADPTLRSPDARRDGFSDILFNPRQLDDLQARVRLTTRMLLGRSLVAEVEGDELYVQSPQVGTLTVDADLPDQTGIHQVREVIPGEIVRFSLGKLPAIRPLALLVQLQSSGQTTHLQVDLPIIPPADDEAVDLG